MILVDTSVWIHHLKEGNATLAHQLERGAVLAHPCVVGELALGRLRRRQEVVELLGGLPQATVATAPEVLMFVEHHELYGIGIGYVDAQLLAATKLTPDARLWSADRRLESASVRLGCAFDPEQADDRST